MDAILFIHHGLHPVAMKHLALFKALNNESEVIPLEADNDLSVYDWFDKNNPKHDRFFIFTWDTFCTQPAREFYGEAYDSKVVGSTIIHPWSDELIQVGPLQCRQRDWHWFTQNQSAELYPYLRGIMPLCGTMLCHEALFNMVQIWKTNRALDNMWPECRLGTLAAMAGYEPKKIKPDAQRYLASAFAFTVDISQGPGIYHPCRT